MSRSIEELLGSVTIRQIARGREARVAPETSLEEVYRLLDEGSRGAVLVCRGDRLVGILTDRDLLYRVALEDVDPATPVGDLMVEEPVSLPPDRSLAEAIDLMSRKRYRHLPLVDDDGRLLGEISSRDILRWVAGWFPEAVLNLPPRLHQTMHRPEGG